jgi:hypothetical protein
MYFSESEVSSVINSEYKQIEEALGDTREKRPRLEQVYWQWEKVYDSYCPRRIQFSENSSPVKSVRSASEAFKLYFDNLIMNITDTETNQSAAELKPCPCVLNWKDVDSVKLHVLLAIKMLMAIHHMPTIKQIHILLSVFPIHQLL